MRFKSTKDNITNQQRQDSKLTKDKIPNNKDKIPNQHDKIKINKNSKLTKDKIPNKQKIRFQINKR